MEHLVCVTLLESCFNDTPENAISLQGAASEQVKTMPTESTCHPTDIMKRQILELISRSVAVVSLFGYLEVALVNGNSLHRVVNRQIMERDIVDTTRPVTTALRWFSSLNTYPRLEVCATAYFEASISGICVLLNQDIGGCEVRYEIGESRILSDGAECDTVTDAGDFS